MNQCPIQWESKTLILVHSILFFVNAVNMFLVPIHLRRGNYTYGYKIGVKTFFTFHLTLILQRLWDLSVFLYAC